MGKEIGEGAFGDGVEVEGADDGGVGVAREGGCKRRGSLELQNRGGFTCHDKS